MVNGAHNAVGDIRLFQIDHVLRGQTNGKGTGGKAEKAFYNVSIADEKEVILIVSRSEQKSDIMRAIIENAGPGTAAGAIVFSLPVSEAAGFGMFEDTSGEEK